VLARSADAPRVGGRELVEAWEEAVEATGLPLHRAAGKSRSRVAFGAPLPLAMAAEHELAEIFLTERVPVWRVREALTGALPAGWTLIDLCDAWVGGPPLAGRVMAADYRVELSGGPDAASIGEAARAVLDAADLPRNRLKGGVEVPYDLRPLLLDVRVVDPGPPVVLRMRTRFHPELGTGRPEEVVAAIGEQLGSPLEVGAIVRERLIVSGEAV
jgi:radical SAM-linked protein